MLSYLTILKRAGTSFGAHKGTSFAAAIAYNAIFSIFPLVLLAIAFLGFFLHNPHQRQSAVDALFGVFGSSVSKDALRTQVDAIAGGSAAIGILGILAAAWSATGVFDQIRFSLQIVWDATKERPLLQQKLIDLGMLLSVGLLIMLSFAATGILAAFERFGAQLVGNSFGWGVQLLFAATAIVVPIALSFCAFDLLYWRAPNAKIHLRNLWFGALIAAIGLEIIQLLFASYVANFGHYSQTYGTLGGIIAFLFFIYIAGCITLFGGEVAKEHIDVLTGVRPATDPEEPKPRQGFLEQAEGLVKALVVDSPTPGNESLETAQIARRNRSVPAVENDAREAEELQAAERDAAHSGYGWETTLLASVAVLTLFGAYELLHQTLGLSLPFVERLKAHPSKR